MTKIQNVGTPGGRSEGHVLKSLSMWQHLKMNPLSEQEAEEHRGSEHFQKPEGMGSNPSCRPPALKP